MAIERVRRLSIQVRHLILQYAAALLSTVRIQRVLEKTHNIKTSRQAIRKFLDRFKRSGSVTDLPKRRRNGNITNFHRQMMNLWLSKNCELTSRALRDKIMAVFGLKLSSSCVSKIRRKLGWTTQRVHIWAGISYRGRTDCCVFTGIMDSITYQQILERNFLPFVARKFPDGYRLYQDNDSKHKSKSTKAWMTEKNMLNNVMECPASSPDINVIENVWASMKYYLESTVKPKLKEELVNGIKQFWENLSAEQCARYIDHIHRVLPVVVLNDGGPSEF
ncbi:unnamed protein product [Mytilus edulis]|uniref:Tc1-like transposase DDE domain-containing protein n=1 Tax=Mytilus edulis TaxID=6550 RepID=A0A8S3VPZ8_MYTED|nr:unnamed protein product [Mytilus edulis]